MSAGLVCTSTDSMKELAAPLAAAIVCCETRIRYESAGNPGRVRHVSGAAHGVPAQSVFQPSSVMIESKTARAVSAAEPHVLTSSVAGPVVIVTW